MFGLFDQIEIIQILDILTHQLDVEVAVVTAVVQFADDILQRNEPFAQLAAILLAIGRMARVAQLDHSDAGNQFRESPDDLRGLAQVVCIKG